VSLRPRKSDGLAARIVRVTFLVGVSTALVAGIVAVMSTSRFVSERAAARDLVALRVLDGAIEERLRASSGVLDRAGTLITQSRDAEDIAASVGPLFSGSRALFDEMLVVDLDGSPLLSTPVDPTPSQVRSFAAFKAALRGATGYAGFANGDATEVWVTRNAVTDTGMPVLILARLDDGFIRRALENTVRDSEGRVAVLLAGDRAIGSAGSRGPIDLSRAEWTPADAALGEVRFSLDGVTYDGYFDAVAAGAGVSWRAVSAEPANVDFMETATALSPAVLVLLVGGLIGVGATWALARRLVRPLRDLERTAKSAAAGAYVKPLPHTGDDEIGRVAGAFNQVALRLNSLHDLSQLLASAAKLDQVLDGILSAVGHIVGPGAAAIYLLDQQGARLVPVRTRGGAMADVRPVAVAGVGWLVAALGSGEPTGLSGTRDSMETEIPGLRGTAASALATPLVAGNETMGLVVCLLDDASGVTEAEREMVRTFSAQAAVAVQTSRLFEVESESRQVAEVLRSVVEQLARPEDLGASLKAVGATIRDFFGASDARLAVADPPSVGLGVPEETPSAEVASALRLGREVYESGESSVLKVRGESVDADLVLGERCAGPLLVVPIALDTDHGAVMTVSLDGASETRKLAIARALGDEIALALDNAYFYERALTRAANLETIFRISQAVASSLQVNVVLNRVLDVVQKILSADAVMLWSYDPVKRALGTAMVRGDVPAKLVNLSLIPGEDLPGKVFESKKPVVVRQLTPSMSGIAGSVAGQDMRALLGVPLLARGRAIGVLMVLSHAPDAFGDEDVSVLQTFASQAALAIDTARLYSREHEVAHILQQSILPEALPEFAEVEAGSVYAPAGSEVEIGGDYYDLFRGPDGSVWFAIADVCGKGVQAATKTSMIKYALRAFVAAGMPPARVVGEVNRMTSDAGDTSDIVTLWAGRYDS